MKLFGLKDGNYTNQKFNEGALLHVALVLACFAILPMAQAVVPAPDGGYPGGNTAEGQGALLTLTTGGFNTAVGFVSLKSDTTGEFNTAIGGGALFSNTTGDANTATGLEALINNTTGDNNTATGLQALENNTTGNNNTANGAGALLSNTTGSANTANGVVALFSNTTGDNNTATGLQALENNTTGNNNTANGAGALLSNTTGSGNVALGVDAGNQVTTASNVIAIGHTGADVSNTTWIGNVYGTTTQSGTTAPVIVSDTGQLGTVASSERFKNHIVTMEKASEAILSLRPVTFHYKTDIKGTPQFGLIAEEVAKVNPALVLPDKEGKPFTVRYDAVNAMLLNEFLKEHQKVQEQQATITELKSTVAQQERNFQATAARQQKQIEALTAGLQKVNAQLAAASPSRGGLELSKFAIGRIRGGGPAPQVVKNP
jgi:uncharacterized coiled-coil protein SlyX